MTQVPAAGKTHFPVGQDAAFGPSVGDDLASATMLLILSGGYRSAFVPRNTYPLTRPAQGGGTGSDCQSVSSSLAKKSPTRARNVTNRIRDLDLWNRLYH